MTKLQKQIILNVALGTKFNLTPQEMAQFVDALNALASDLQAETAGVQVPIKREAEGGDPFAEAGD